MGLQKASHSFQSWQSQQFTSLADPVADSCHTKLLVHKNVALLPIDGGFSGKQVAN
jgi:hypothetical protein